MNPKEFMLAAQQNEKSGLDALAATQFRKEAMLRLLEPIPDIKGAARACNDSARCYQTAKDTTSVLKMQNFESAIKQLTARHTDFKELIRIIKGLDNTIVGRDYTDQKP